MQSLFVYLVFVTQINKLMEYRQNTYPYDYPTYITQNSYGNSNSNSNSYNYNNKNDGSFYLDMTKTKPIIMEQEQYDELLKVKFIAMNIIICGCIIFILIMCVLLILFIYYF